MHNSVYLPSILILALAANSIHAKEKPDASALQSEKEKQSYAIGADIGKNFKRLNLDVDLKPLLRGLEEAYSGKPLALTEDELRLIMSDYQNQLREKQASAIKAIGEANLKKGEAFLAENAKKPDVVSLPSGLQYKILQPGSGKTPGDEDLVDCNYRGTLLDGTEFDSSYRTGKPAAFKLSGVIPGWSEALKLMPAGSKWQLFIPPKLAYGPRGAGRDIGPNSTLIFEVELVNVHAAPAAPVNP